MESLAVPVEEDVPRPVVLVEEGVRFLAVLVEDESAKGSTASDSVRLSDVEPEEPRLFLFPMFVGVSVQGLSLWLAVWVQGLAPWARGPLAEPLSEPVVEPEEPVSANSQTGDSDSQADDVSPSSGVRLLFWVRLLVSLLWEPVRLRFQAD